VVNGSGPGRRCYYTTTVVGSKLFVFGGRIGGNGFNDMWALDLNCRTFAYCCSEPFRPDIPAVKSQPLWESYEPTPGNEKPLPRSGHVSVTTEGRIIVFVSLTFALYPRYNFL
jgi:Kelch motif